MIYPSSFVSPSPSPTLLSSLCPVFQSQSQSGKSKSHANHMQSRTTEQRGRKWSRTINGDRGPNACQATSNLYKHLRKQNAGGHEEAVQVVEVVQMVEVVA
ncbi:hypothetical protein ACLKA7_011966 [Drosophila subpalustris]